LFAFDSFTGAFIIAYLSAYAGPAACFFEIYSRNFFLQERGNCAFQQANAGQRLNMGAVNIGSYAKT
jgi:hypothetical protein